MKTHLLEILDALQSVVSTTATWCIVGASIGCAAGVAWRVFKVVAL